MVILYPYLTEKALKLAEKENKVTFIVDQKANKIQIKQEIEKKFNVKVEKVNIVIMRDGRKKAYVKLKKEYKASELISKLGII